VRNGSELALIDAGPFGTEDEILGAVADVGGGPGDLGQIVLTHSHKDHAGSAGALVARTGARLSAGARDASVIAGRDPEPPPDITPEERPFYEQVVDLLPAAPPVAVDRLLDDGDDLGWPTPAVVVSVPGHTAGSIAVHLPDERLVFTGDNIAAIGDRPILGPFNVDRAGAIASFHRLAALDVDIACFGHGDPLLADAGSSLRRAAARL